MSHDTPGSNDLGPTESITGQLEPPRSVRPEGAPHEKEGQQKEEQQKRLDQLYLVIVHEMTRLTEGRGRFERQSLAHLPINPKVRAKLVQRAVDAGVIEPMAQDSTTRRQQYRVPGIHPVVDLSFRKGGLQWTPEERREARQRIVEAAKAKRTPTPWFGYVPLSKQLGISARIVKEIVAELVREGILVTKGLHKRHRDNLPAETRPGGWTSEAWAELRVRADAIGRERTTRDLGLTQKQLDRLLPVPIGAATQLIHEFIAEGIAVPASSTRTGGGCHWVGVKRFVPSAVTLHQILGAADAASKHREWAGLIRRGRRRMTDPLPALVITPSQFEEMRASAALVAKAITGSERDLQGVTAGYLRRPDASASFEILDRLAKASDARSLAQWKGDASWCRDDNSQRARHLASFSRLLLFAEATGLLPFAGGEPAVPTRTFVPVAWEKSLVAAMAAVNPATTQTRSRVFITGLRTLLRAAMEQPADRLEEVAWNSVSHVIQTAPTTISGTMAKREVLRFSASAKRAARLVFEDLRTHGVISADPWPTRQLPQLALFPGRALAELVAAKPNRRDYSRLRLPDGRVPAALLEGPLGLRNALLWWSGEAMMLSQAGLPGRNLVSLRRVSPDAERRYLMQGRSRRDPYQLGSESLRMRLQRLNILAGCAVNLLGRDPATVTLLSLCDPALVACYRERFLSDSTTQPGSDEFSNVVGTIKTLQELTVLACPTLAVLAQHEALRLARNGSEADLVSAKAWRRQVKALDRFATELHATIHELRNTWYRKRKNKPAILQAWVGTSGINPKDALLQLDALFDAQLRRLQRLAIPFAARQRPGGRGGYTLEQQIAMVREGTLTRSHLWAAAGRVAFITGLVRRVPLRRRTLSELTLDQWRAGTGEMTGGRLTAPWEGHIWLDIPAHITKMRRPFRPNVVTLEGRERPENRSFLQLLELYFMPGGIRDTLLDPPRGRSSVRVEDMPWVIPMLQIRSARPTAKPIGGSQLSSLWRRSVLFHAADIGADADQLRALPCAASLHIVRLLFGTTLVARSKIHEATKLLQHSHSRMTEHEYAAADESNIDLRL